MASNRQIEANRRNATRSTGPKTAAGKTRSSHNALRHGLARCVVSDPAEAENFAVAIASGLGDQVTLDAAMALARSKLALLRLRSLRQAMLAALLNRPVPDVNVSTFSSGMSGRRWRNRSERFGQSD